uniref:Uncharacterized protein n=1 Tax=Graphocephala atropunctata TaxID=36148 RepID=A0A1B6KL07_9HEMI
MFKKHTRVIHLGEDCDDKNWIFQFQKSKKIVLRRNKLLKSAPIRSEQFYNFETGISRSVCKKSKNFRNISLEDVTRGVLLKEDKKQDVKRLLELHFGESWAQNELLQFYIKVFEEQDMLRRLETQGDDQTTEIDDNIDFDLNEDEPTEIV